jgi:hypothetical protein
MENKVPGDFGNFEGLRNGLVNFTRAKFLGEVSAGPKLGVSDIEIGFENFGHFDIE